MPSYGRRKNDKVDIERRSSIRSQRVVFHRILFVIGGPAAADMFVFVRFNRSAATTIETKLRAVLTTHFCVSRFKGYLSKYRSLLFSSNSK